MDRVAFGRRSVWVVLVALLLVSGGALLSPSGVAAAACNVTSLANSGASTLRDAVNTPGCDPINITIPGTITLDAGTGSTATPRW
jgi:hypothetical protein